MNARALVERLRVWFEGHSSRDRAVILGVAAAMLASLAYVVIVEPLIAYRRAVAVEITEGQERLERAARFLGAAERLRAEHDELRRRLTAAEARLLPGGSGTLGAAALQDQANTLAAEKGVTVQTTQVMREEVVEPFRRVAVRLTVSAELAAIADLIAGLEYGPQQLRIPFLELSRRGASGSTRGPRPLTGTIEVSGLLLIGTEPEDAGESEPAGPPAPEEG